VEILTLKMGMEMDTGLTITIIFMGIAFHLKEEDHRRLK
jgi:hypothetical protein